MSPRVVFLLLPAFSAMKDIIFTPCLFPFHACFWLMAMLGNITLLPLLFSILRPYAFSPPRARCFLWSLWCFSRFSHIENEMRWWEMMSCLATYSSFPFHAIFMLPSRRYSLFSFSFPFFLLLLFIFFFDIFFSFPSSSSSSRMTTIIRGMRCIITPACFSFLFFPHSIEYNDDMSRQHRCLFLFIIFLSLSFLLLFLLIFIFPLFQIIFLFFAFRQLRERYAVYATIHDNDIIEDDWCFLLFYARAQRAPRSALNFSLYRLDEYDDESSAREMMPCAQSGGDAMMKDNVINVLRFTFLRHAVKDMFYHLRCHKRLAERGAHAQFPAF